ncbi:aldehyde dehydrogenase family protein [Variovorax guangxiensis]|uniref:aldehyde dehydrogenase family protein n=1 Tax=Variovorax guangxiensis TaxID=1775474 RepID=UPI0028665FC5|nr:aldehyde dehydrogenase family protein [Variovorax guangxiensis]MDR6858793.1 aldehyde dehydrogenase (NAD+) [Variovorax guangxiensis]
MTLRERPLPRARLLGERDKRHFIDGKWIASLKEERIETFNPATGTVLATLSRGRAEDVDRAVRAARSAFEGPWRSFTPGARQQIIMRFAELFEKNFEELTLLESLDMGAPLQKRLRAGKSGIIQTILYFAAQARSIGGENPHNSLAGNVTTMIVKAPVGVVGAIIPWNGPLFSQMHVLGPVLATGCTAVIKPAEDASLAILRTAELLLEAGLPPGVVNVVTGIGAEAGAALAAHPDVNRLAFTGSTQVGREIIKASAGNMKRLQLELGGKSPDIVFADADLDKAVPGVAMGVYANSGQICFAGTRIFVQRSVQEQFVERLSAYSKSLKVGDPLEDDTVLGPLISQRQLDRVLGYVQSGQAEGASLVSGGSRIGGKLAEGYYLEPTVFGGVSNSMKVAREEIFGPVASVIPFDTVEEVLQLANDSPYGLASGVWSSNVNTVMRMVHGIQAGTVWVNCYGMIDPAVGFGGYKESGYGWKGGEAQIDGYLYQKAAYINVAN